MTSNSVCATMRATPRKLGSRSATSLFIPCCASTLSTIEWPVPELLVVFQHLFVERRVSLVADKLGLTQPAISNALARLRKIWTTNCSCGLHAAWSRHRMQTN
jgi:hypothetical protein